MKIVTTVYPGMSGEAIRAIYGCLIPFNETGFCRAREDCVINDMLFLESRLYPIENDGGTITILNWHGYVVSGMIHMEQTEFEKYFHTERKEEV